jgi:hypothetical protein
MTATVAPDAPAGFRRAIATLARGHLRDGIEIGELAAPARLAPWTHAVSVTLTHPYTGVESATGRMVLLHDPDGVAAWEGTLRVVIFASCEVEGEMAQDPMLPQVAWSWLTEALTSHDVDHVALGGTVTATSSTRFGDIAGPPRTDELEVRASWTALGDDLSHHLTAFAAFLASAAGLPPEGVTPFRVTRHPSGVTGFHET